MVQDQNQGENNDSRAYVYHVPAVHRHYLEYLVKELCKRPVLMV